MTLLVDLKAKWMLDPDFRKSYEENTMDDFDKIVTLLADKGAEFVPDVGTDQSEMESALESVAQSVCESWEVFGSDSEMSVVTDVDGHIVRLTVSVELIG